MKKRIAYLGFSYVPGNFKRAKAYILANPEFEHHFLTIDNYQGEIDYDFGTDVTISKMEETPNVFDLVLITTDKAFESYLRYRNLTGINNLADKKILSNTCKAFGLLVPKETGFNDDDFVVVKPKISSGCYSAEDFCYRKIRYSDLCNYKDFNTDNYILQECVDSDHVFQFNFVTNGDEIKFCGMVDFQFQLVNNENINPIYNTFYHNVEQFSRHVAGFENKINELEKLKLQVKNYLISEKYYLIPSYYQFQFIRRGDEYLVIDNNLRIGPGMIEASINNILKNNFFTNMKFMLKLQDLDSLECDQTKGYSFYTEKSGKRQTNSSKYLIEDYENRVQCFEEKSSGFLRSDCCTFIQAITYKE